MCCGHLITVSEFSVLGRPYSFADVHLVVVYLAVVQGSLAAGQWLSFGPNIAQASNAMKRIMSLRVPDPSGDDSSEGDASALTLTPDLAENPDPETEEIEKVIKGPKVEFKNVWFKYPTRDVYILKGLDMTVREISVASLILSQRTFSRVEMLTLRRQDRTRTIRRYSRPIWLRQNLHSFLTHKILQPSFRLYSHLLTPSKLASTLQLPVFPFPCSTRTLYPYRNHPLKSSPWYFRPKYGYRGATRSGVQGS